MGLVEAAESGLDLRRLLLASGEGKEVGRLQKCIFFCLINNIVNNIPFLTIFIMGNYDGRSKSSKGQEISTCNSKL